MGNYVNQIGLNLFPLPQFQTNLAAQPNLPAGNYFSAPIFNFSNQMMSQFNMNYNMGFTPSFFSPAFSGTSSNTSVNTNASSRELSVEQLNNEYKKKLAEAMAADKTRVAEQYRTAAFTAAERETAEEFVLKDDAKESVNKMGGMGSTIAAGSLFAAPATYRMASGVISPKTPALSDAACKSTLNLYNTNPELVENAYKSLNNIEKAYLKDLKAVGSNPTLVNNVNSEITALNTEFEAVLRSGTPQDLAKFTAKIDAAQPRKVNNNWFRRLIRGWKGEDKVISRQTVMNDAVASGKVKPVVPKTGFLNTLKGGLKAGALFAVFPILLDFTPLGENKIKKAYSMDKETGNKQLAQMGVKGLISGLFYTAGDAVGKTIARKVVTKLATKILVKGGCKILGSALGSVIPGVGTVVGCLVGCVADFLISKYVVPKIFPNDAVKKKEVKVATDEELTEKMAEAYMRSDNKIQLTSSQMSLLRGKLTEEQFTEVQRVHNMDKKAKEEYFAELQNIQQQAMQQQALQAQQGTLA